MSLGISLDSFRTLSVFFTVLIFSCDLWMSFSFLMFSFYFCSEFCPLVFYNPQLFHYILLKFLNFYFVVFPLRSDFFINLLKIMAKYLITLSLCSVTPFLLVFYISWNLSYSFIYNFFLLTIIEKLTFRDPVIRRTFL